MNQEDKMRLNAIRFLAEIDKLQPARFRGVPVDQFNTEELVKIIGLVREQGPAPTTRISDSPFDYKEGDYARVIGKGHIHYDKTIHVDSVDAERRIVYSHYPGDLYTVGFRFADLVPTERDPSVDPVVVEIGEELDARCSEMEKANSEASWAKSPKEAADQIEARWPTYVGAQVRINQPASSFYGRLGTVRYALPNGDVGVRFDEPDSNGASFWFASKEVVVV